MTSRVAGQIACRCSRYINHRVNPTGWKGCAGSFVVDDVADDTNARRFDQISADSCHLPTARFWIQPNSKNTVTPSADVMITAAMSCSPLSSLE